MYNGYRSITELPLCDRHRYFLCIISLNLCNDFLNQRPLEENVAALLGKAEERRAHYWFLLVGPDT